MLTEREEKVIRWLRKMEDESTGAEARAYWNARFSIERGDHLTWKPEPTIPASEWSKVSNVGH